MGQGFQPKAEKSAIEYAKKHRKEYENSENNSLKITLV